MSEKIQQLIDAEEAATWLALSRRVLIRMARNGQIPCFALPSGDFVFDRTEVQEWLNGQRPERAEATDG